MRPVMYPPPQATYPGGIFFAHRILGGLLNSKNEIVQSFVLVLDKDLREAWEERAAIMEFDGGISRELAECLALLVIIRTHPTRVLKLLH